MENLKQLHEEESIVINGGTDGVYPDGRGDDGCIPDPLKDLLGSSTGPTFPNPDSF